MMAVAKDWMMHAALEIEAFVNHNNPLPEEIATIIERHCPFQLDVAYEPVREPPLLMCVDCKNTESPAGAMARQHFNPGRCMHCGGYFRVIRA